MFDPKSTKYAADREALTQLWSEDEWRAARRTVLNAHYTDPAYVKAMWGAVTGLGVPENAVVLEPGCGTGNFIGQAPSGTRIEGVELDPTTADIARLLHPGAKVTNESFAETVLNPDHDGYDAVIGNVPFAQTKLYDSAYNEKNLSLHNHFIAKSLRLTKPGGVVAVMSSRYTLDAKNDVARREISKCGELLGAVRMPVGAHQKVAGTDVIIDVLVFKRHEEGALVDEAPAWLKTVDVDGASGKAAMNQYFVDSPEHVLGRVDTRIGQFGPELTVVGTSRDSETIAGQLEKSLGIIVGQTGAQTWAARGQRVTDRPVARSTQDPARIVGHIFVDESGNLKQNGVAGIVDVKVPKNAVAELRDLLTVRDEIVGVLELEGRSSNESAELAAARAELNRVYDAYAAKYGPLSRVTTSVREREGKEPLIRRTFPAAVRAMRVDPHYATLAALELYNEDTGEARKATVFTERVVGVTREVTRAESPDDAIAISLDRVGHVDPVIVSELLDIPTDTVETALGERVFRDFTDPQILIPANEFLSGDVRAKLREATGRAAEESVYERHVKQLERVIPDELGPAEIDVKLGASWVPHEHVRGWIENITGKPVKALERINGEWNHKIVGKPSSTVEARWNVIGDVKSLSMYTVMKMVMNGQKLQVKYKPDPSENVEVIDTTATEALQQRAEEMHDHFADWLWKDADRGEELKTRYNDLYNNIVLRSYDDVKLSLPGMAATFTPYPHQHAAVARMLSEPSVGLFHEVGAGKTAEMVMGVMELRRLGLVTKPAIVVPNQMLEQFTREFKQIYPRAKVLSAGSADMAKSGSYDGRQMFVARARTGDWDAVILTHGAFERIGLGESERVYAQEKLDELHKIHGQRLSSEINPGSVKRLEDQLDKEEAKLKMMLDLKHDDGITFEETGIDYLCVDEAHLFKNLTVTSNVEDLNKANGAARAQDLDMKLWYLRDHKSQSRVATLATATPSPNSMIEMYVMQRYLRPDLLQAAEVYSANDWAKQFTEQVTAVEYKAEGGYQVKTRTVKFRNMPELLRMWHIPGDVKTQADLKLKVPLQAMNSNGKRAPEMVIVDPTEAQIEGMEDLIQRGKAVRDGAVEPEEDNMLKITSNGRALALDQRLLGLEAPGDDEETKLGAVAQKVFEVYERTKDDEYLDEWGGTSDRLGSLQIIFSDLGTPKALRSKPVEGEEGDNDEYDWNVYTHLKRDLVALGIPEEKIQFIHSATDDVKKAELFQKSRDGRVSVLLGSTSKMGVGTNIQTRAVALHHVDAPWRPADVTQREGRIVRQKNQNSEVQIFRYATEGSFDAYMWGALARKAAFIDQVLSGRLDVREVDNSTEMALEFAEMQAVAAGDMRILEKANLSQDITKLRRNEKAHRRQISSVDAQIDYHNRTVSGVTADIAILQKYRSKAVSTLGDEFVGNVKTRTYDTTNITQERARFGALLREKVGEYFDGKDLDAAQRLGFGTHNTHYPRPIPVEVDLGGLTWQASLRWNGKTPLNPTIVFRTEKYQETPLDMEVPFRKLIEGEDRQVSRRFEIKVNQLETTISGLERQLDGTRETLAELREMSKVPWAKADELAAKQERFDELTLALEAEVSATPEDREMRQSQAQVVTSLALAHTYRNGALIAKGRI